MRCHGIGGVVLVGGASGGPHIITATVQVILNYVARGMDIASAVFAPRLHSQLLPDVVYFENQTLPFIQQRAYRDLLQARVRGSGSVSDQRRKGSGSFDAGTSRNGAGTGAGLAGDYIHIANSAHTWHGLLSKGHGVEQVTDGPGEFGITQFIVRDPDTGMAVVI